MRCFLSIQRRTNLSTFVDRCKWTADEIENGTETGEVTKSGLPEDSPVLRIFGGVTKSTVVSVDEKDSVPFSRILGSPVSPIHSSRNARNLSLLGIKMQERTNRFKSYP